MVEFKCQRCGHDFVTKQALCKHLQRKKECPPIASLATREQLLEELLFNPKQVHACTFCGKKFTQANNMYRHRVKCPATSTNTTKEQETILDKTSLLEEEVKTLREELQQLKLHVASTSQQVIQNNTTNNNTTNNTINNTMNIHVHLRDFGNENMEAIPSDFLQNAIIHLDLRGMMEELHFDPNFPENHNIRLKSIKREVLEIYQNNSWKQMPLLKGVNAMIMQGVKIAKQYYRNNKDELEKEMSEDEILELLDNMDKLAKEDVKMTKPYQKDLTSLLEEKRSMLAT